LDLAEHALGRGILDRFIVFNQDDLKKVNEVRNKAGCGKDCGLFLIKESPRYNVPGPPGVDGIETVASVLSISDDNVFNCLGRSQQSGLVWSSDYPLSYARL
jgi:hypothetical protein